MTAFDSNSIKCYQAAQLVKIVFIYFMEGLFILDKFYCIGLHFE